MKKIYSVIIAAVLFCAYGHADQAVTVNPGGTATQGHFPVYGLNADSQGQKVQAIYLADPTQRYRCRQRNQGIDFLLRHPNSILG